MKKIIYLLLTGVLCYNFSYAQNWFPSSGPVGIGTTTPTSQLELFNLDLSKPNGVNAYLNFRESERSIMRIMKALNLG